jgi:ketosteroid isomerase-like protein
MMLSTNPMLRTLLITLFAATPLAAQRTSPHLGSTAERAAVLAVADSALAAISRTDFVGLTDLMLDSAVTFSAGERNGQFRNWFSSRATQRASRMDGTITERGFRPEVRVSGPLAVVWMPYDLYINDAWSHCGVDTFTMLRTPQGGWRIASLVWSVEQPPACEKHPDGPPVV